MKLLGSTFLTNVGPDVGSGLEVERCAAKTVRYRCTEHDSTSAIGFSENEANAVNNPDAAFAGQISEFSANWLQRNAACEYLVYFHYV